MTVLLLMNAKGLAVLQALIPYRRNIRCVVGARDGHVKNDYYDEIRGLSLANGIAFCDKSDMDAHVAGDCYKIAVGWRWLIHDTSRLIIMHDSLLPRYRGFSPLVAQLINGETTIGVTALMASECYDEGDVIAQEKINVTYPIKIARAIDLISGCYVKLAVDIVARLVDGGRLPTCPQCHQDATYCLWRDEKDYAIDWRRSAQEIWRFVDAVGYPYSGATARINGVRCIVNDVELVPDVYVENRSDHIGKVIFMKDESPVVVCGAGFLRIVSAKYADGTDLKFSSVKFRSRFS